MKTVLLFCIVNLCSLVNTSYGQTDSIYSLNAQVVNGRLQATLLSTYDLAATIEVSIYVNDMSNKNLAIYVITKSGNNTFFSKTGSCNVQVQNNGDVKFIMDELIFDNIKNIPARFDFTIKGPGYISNKLTFQKIN